MSKKKIKTIFQRDYYYLTRTILPVLIGAAATLFIIFLITREIYTVGCFNSYKLRADASGGSFAQCRALFLKE